MDATGTRAPANDIETHMPTKYPDSEPTPEAHAYINEENNSKHKEKLKYVALIALVLQTVGSIYVLRMTHLQPSSDGRKYITRTAVIMAEAVKLLAGVIIVLKECDYDIVQTYKSIIAEFVDNPIDTLKMSIPAVLYTLQNNLIYTALFYISGAVYQVTYQLKILTTALLSVIILHKKLSASKWIALFILAAGVAIIELKSDTQPKKEQNVIVGIIAVCAACCTSGLAGVYLEKMLKQSTTSIWMRNIQLALFSGLIGLGGTIMYDYKEIVEFGFFQGYNIMVVNSILIQALGGLIVAAVLKYADNILKCFGNAIAISLSCVVSWLMGDFVFTPLFLIGTAMIIFATYQYSVEPKFKVQLHS